MLGVQRTDSTGARYVTPPGVADPFYDTHHQAPLPRNDAPPPAEHPGDWERDGF